jgi:oxaloacetate decarboxylase (Na+ extruding) subunit alpha
MVIDKKSCYAGGGSLQLVDETMRDGPQSLWGLGGGGYHGLEPIIGEIVEAGYYCVNVPVTSATPLCLTRFGKEDPREFFRMFREKLKNCKTNIGTIPMGMAIDLTGEAENKTMIKMLYRQFKAWLPNLNQYFLMCCCEDEIKNTFPILFPLLRSLGMEPIPYMAIGHSPRHTEEFYVTRVKHLVETYKPISICLKDVDGLLTPERLRTLVPAIQAVAGDTPLELHMHGMNGLQTYNAVVAMELGVRKFTTCIPPLAYGSSHPSVYNIVHNAEQLGIPHTMNLEKIKIVEERLTKIGKVAGMPVDNHPLPFDLFLYKHQIPGGVISNLTTQLGQLGVPEILQDVLEEIPRILEDMGYPVMITPFSQFIVTQAVLNVQLGRWEQCLDAMIKFAAGMYGIEEAGVPYMNQNVKDKLLSLPAAKEIKEKGDHIVEYINSEPSEEDCKRRFGMSPDASDEDFILRVLLHGDEEMKQVTPGGPDAYTKYL